MDFITVKIPLTDPVKRDQVIGQLSLWGFSGFEESEDSLHACIPESDFPEAENALREIAAGENFHYHVEHTGWQNWNEVWERSFSPVRIGGFCGIRACFHPPLEGVAHELVITPQMTFGTGHHATTASMIRLMEDLPFRNKMVFDFGTGTGILAILAAKMGATVEAADNDPEAVLNARQNAAENGVAEKISFFEADRAGDARGRYDHVLANIQLDVIVANLRPLKALLRPGGNLLVSGVLETAVAQLYEAAAAQGLAAASTLTEDGWTAVRFITPEPSTPHQ